MVLSKFSELSLNPFFIYGTKPTTISFQDIDFLFSGCSFMKEHELVFQIYRLTSKTQSLIPSCLTKRVAVKKEKSLWIKLPWNAKLNSQKKTPWFRLNQFIHDPVTPPFPLRITDHLLPDLPRVFHSKMASSVGLRSAIQKEEMDAKSWLDAT